MNTKTKNRRKKPPGRRQVKDLTVKELEALVKKTVSQEIERVMPEILYCSKQAARRAVGKSPLDILTGAGIITGILAGSHKRGGRPVIGGAML